MSMFHVTLGAFPKRGISHHIENEHGLYLPIRSCLPLAHLLGVLKTRRQQYFHGILLLFQLLGVGRCHHNLHPWC